MKNNYLKFFFIGLFVFISSCSTNGIKVQEYPSTASPSDEINKLEDNINYAMVNQVNVLSYNNFKKANEQLKKAKENYRKQKSAKNTLHMVSKGNAYLDRANKVAEMSHTYINEVVLARKKAINAGAKIYFKDVLKDIDKKLIDITNDFENNKIQVSEKTRVNLQNMYLDLELSSIKEANLGKAAKLIHQAKQLGAKNYAPRTLAIAEKSYKDAQAYITGDRYNKYNINKVSDEAIKKAEHVLKITKDSKLDNRITSEDASLKNESVKDKLNKKHDEYVEATDLKLQQQRNRNIDSQNQLSESLEASRSIKESNRNLRAEKDFASSFDKARSDFSSSEADVYKKGDTLVIRLKKLNFPSSKAVITKSNFNLLSKVSNVIKDFKNSSVIVQGHTDSIGSKVANQSLSLQRARTVKEYLVTNGAANSNKIVAVGYGSQKPLSSNKTSSGRAINRRVDILIKPENLNY